MKLIPSIFAITAVTAQLCVTAPVRAESHWLVLSLQHGVSMSVIQMKSAEQCEEQGAAWISSKRIDAYTEGIGFECLEGK